MTLRLLFEGPRDPGVVVHMPEDEASRVVAKTARVCPPGVMVGVAKDTGARVDARRRE